MVYMLTGQLALTLRLCRASWQTVWVFSTPFLLFCLSTFRFNVNHVSARKRNPLVISSWNSLQFQLLAFLCRGNISTILGSVLHSSAGVGIFFLQTFHWDFPWQFVQVLLMGSLCSSEYISVTVHLSFDSITQHLVCVVMPITQNVWGRFLRLWTWLDAHSAVEIVLFISQHYCAALHSFTLSVFRDAYTLLGDSGYM